MSRAAPRPLSLSLELLRAQITPASPLAGVQAVWADAVGAAIATEAQPVSLVDGVLLVECASSVWTAELTMMAAELCERVNATLAEGSKKAPTLVVSSLRCRTR